MYRHIFERFAKKRGQKTKQKAYSGELAKKIREVLKASAVDFTFDRTQGIFYMITELKDWAVVVQAELKQEKIYMTIRLPLVYDAEDQALLNEVAKYVNLRTLDGYDYRMDYDTGEVFLYAYLDCTNLYVTPKILRDFLLEWEAEGFAADMVGFIMVVSGKMTAESANTIDFEAEELIEDVFKTEGPLEKLGFNGARPCRESSLLQS